MDKISETSSVEETLQSPQNPEKRSNETIDRTFRRAAILGHCLGLFPCSSVLLKEHPKNVAPHYLLIPTFVSVVLYISSLTGSLFALLLYLNQFRTVTNLRLKATDSFALKFFLASLLVSRAIAPLFCLYRAKSIALLVQKVARYDKGFGVLNSTGFINFTFLVLISGSAINCVANTMVAWPVMYNVYKQDEFPTMFRLFGFKSPVLEFLHGFSGGFYGELGVIFISTTTLFLARALRKRIVDLEYSLTNCFSGRAIKCADTQDAILRVSIKKLKALYAIKQDFQDIFGPLMVLYVGFSTVLLVTTFYSLISFGVSYHKRDIEVLWSHEFLSILSVVSLTFFRLFAFVEVGESLVRVGGSLRHQISFANPLKSEGIMLAYLQRISDVVDFSFHCNGYFVMRRDLITAILGAVLTFTIVLGQFRHADD